MNVRLTKGLSGLLVVRLNRQTADSWTHGLVDLQTRGLAPEIFTAGILFLCRHTACVSLRVRETYGLVDSGRIGGLLSILSYIESLYIQLLICVRLAIAVP